MKYCITCKTKKPREDFFRNNFEKDGLDYYCKQCERKQKRKQRVTHKKTYTQKDKRYYQKHREKILLKRKEWYHKNKYKRLAHEKVKNALYKGELTRPEKCQTCYKKPTKQLVAHHEDYSKPLDVVWLCESCHMMKHFGKE